MNVPVLLFAAVALWAQGASAQTIHAVTETGSQTMVVDGKVVGPWTEGVKLILKNAGLPDYRISVYPWARAYQLALHEPNTLIYPIARTAARERQFKWVGEMQTVHYHFVKLADRKDIVIKRLDDARAYSIGVVRDDVRHQYLQAHGFANLYVGAKWNDNVTHLLNRQIDVLILGELDLVPLCAAQALDCAMFEQLPAVEELTTNLYLAFARSTPETVVNRARMAYDRLKADGTIERVVNAKP
ncbi:MAG: transporter substrate-binding domain-containing protein [Pseudomonadota bacterium]